VTAAPLQTLPALRQDLKLLPETTDETGAPRWLVFDALQNRYHALTRRGLLLVEAWRAGMPVDRFVADLAAAGVPLAPGELDDFVAFLARNELLEARGQAGDASIERRRAARARPLETSLIKNYLFFRVPVVRPDAFLRRTLGAVAWTTTDLFRAMTILAGLFGLFLAGRQWDMFVAAFRDAVSLQGAAAFVVTIAAVKIVHELAHGYTARRLGCRVASIGVAFIVLFPILYTDTTDTWRLRDRFQRLKVVTAGLKSELYLAAWATLLWAILPDGIVRSVAFYVATTGWISSALINLSPLLRFDGYYAFSDLLGMENLQARGFALGRWFLRRLLFGLPDPAPETLPPARLRLVLFYAYLTWVYRFFVFLGIALLVYHLAFKVLGVFLFLVEIYWFIARPVLAEVRVWWRRRREARLSPLRALVLSALLGGLVWAAWPMPRSVAVPAVLDLTSEDIYAPRDARVRAIAADDGSRVRRGDTLLRLEAPALEAERALLRRELAGLEEQLAANTVRRGALPLLRERRADVRTRLTQVGAALAEMTIAADRAGRLAHVAPLSPGQWVGQAAPLAQVRDPAEMRIHALMKETDVSRLDPDAGATFVAPWPRRLRLANVPVPAEVTPVRQLAFEELADVHGGPLAVAAAGDGRTLETPAMAIEIPVSEISGIDLRHRLRGVLRLRTEPESLVLRWGRALSRVIWRELQI
jgi:putative peptide zinc metalloprotease protein